MCEAFADKLNTLLGPEGWMITDVMLLKDTIGRERKGMSIRTFNFIELYFQKVAKQEQKGRAAGELARAV